MVLEAVLDAMARGGPICLNFLPKLRIPPQSLERRGNCIGRFSGLVSIFRPLPSEEAM